MSTLKDKSAPHAGLTRRSALQSTAAILAVPFLAKITTASAQERIFGTGEVVAFSNGGSLTLGLRRSVHEPFTKATGIKVIEVTGDFSEPLIKAMFNAGRVDWDVVTVSAHNYPDMHEKGMFLPIDYSHWDKESIAGTAARARLEDAVVGYYNALLIAYDQRVFPNGGPQNWRDFWDVKKFPGPRGLYAPEAKRNFVPALLADGVAPGDIWPLTDDKVDRAFRKLNEIKPHVAKWWSAGGESPQLLINREYVMTSAYDGRALSAIQQGAPIKMVWDGAYLVSNYMTILKGGPNSVNAQKLIAFYNRAQIAAAFTQDTGFPGANVNQLAYLPAELKSMLSVNPDNSSKTIMEDSAWLAAKRPDGKSNVDHLQERWLAWRAQ